MITLLNPGFVLAIKLNATNLEVIGVNGIIYVNWSEQKNVVGIQLGLRQFGELNLNELSVSGVTGLGAIWATLKNGTSSRQKLLRISQYDTDLNHKEPINHLLISLKDESIDIADCNNRSELSSVYCFDQGYHALFYIPRGYDNCRTPDAPLVALANGIPNLNGDGLIANYTCKPGTRLKSDLKAMPTCSKDGDWTDYNLDPCELNKCDPTDFIRVISRFEPEQPIDQISPGTKAFLKCPGVGVNVSRTCLDSGEWTVMPETCPTSNNSNVSVLILVLVIIASVIVILITGGISMYVCFKKKSTPIRRSSPIDSVAYHREVIDGFGTYDS